MRRQTNPGKKEQGKERERKGGDGKSKKIEQQQRQAKVELGDGVEGMGGGEIVSFFLGTGLNPSWSSVAAFPHTLLP